MLIMSLTLVMATFQTGCYNITWFVFHVKHPHTCETSIINYICSGWVAICLQYIIISGIIAFLLLLSTGWELFLPLCSISPGINRYIRFTSSCLRVRWFSILNFSNSFTRSNTDTISNSFSSDFGKTQSWSNSLTHHPFLFLSLTAHWLLFLLPHLFKCFL